MTVHAREFKTADDLMAHYKAMKARVRYAPPASSLPARPAPEPKAGRRFLHLVTGAPLVRVRSGVPKLRGFPTKAEAKCIYPRPIGPVLPVRDILIVSTPGRGLAPGIVAQVCAKHHLTKEDIMARTRRAYITQARHEACYRLRKETLLSLNQIAIHLGGLDHTTVLHGIRKHQERLAQGLAL